jgi:hypothetical protein
VRESISNGVCAGTRRGVTRASSRVDRTTVAGSGAGCPKWWPCASVAQVDEQREVGELGGEELLAGHTGAEPVEVGRAAERPSGEERER